MYRTDEFPPGLLEARADDCVSLCERTGKSQFLGFLNEGQRAFLEPRLKRYRDVRFRFWGGYEEAARTMLCVCPGFADPLEAEYPFQCVSIRIKGEGELTQRDFLGALMGLQLKRMSLGDIVVQAGGALCFAQPAAAKLILAELNKVGRLGVKTAVEESFTVTAAQEFLDIRTTIASSRMDVIVAALLNTGREKSARLIESGLVQRNYQTVTSVSAQAAEGDVVAIRGSGKFLLDAIGPQTKKGRWVLSARKYK